MEQQMKIENEQSKRSLPTSDEIVKALRNAGWLLEHDTATAIEKSGFNVVTGKAFPDPDDPSISREIDVFGHRNLFQSKELSFSIGVRILAECKQSSLPYVIVGGPISQYHLTRVREEQQFRFPTVETQHIPLSDGATRVITTQAKDYLGLTELPGNPWEENFLGNQMTRLDRKKDWLADNQGIFTSLIYPLAKALKYFKSQSNRTTYVAHMPEREWATIDFYYPLVVTSAPIFVVDATRPELKAKQVPWATVTREIKSTKINGQFNVDVVTAAALEDYLATRINLFASAVIELAEKNPQRFINHKDLDYQR